MSTRQIYNLSACEADAASEVCNSTRTHRAVSRLEDLARRNWRGHITDDEFRSSRAAIQAVLATQSGSH